MAGLAVARERLNPEAVVEFEKETPKQSFGFSVPLELGGKRAKRIAVGEATIRAGEAELAATIAQVRNDVRRAYFGLLVAETRLSLMQEMRDISVRARDTAQERFDAGDAPRLEVLQAELALASAENDVAAARGEARSAPARSSTRCSGSRSTRRSSLSSAVRCGHVAHDESRARAGTDASTELACSIDRSRRSAPASRSRGRSATPDVIPTATLTHDAQPEFTTGGAPASPSRFRSSRLIAPECELEQSTLDQLSAQRQASLSRIDGAVTAAAVTRRGTTAALPALPRRDPSAGATGRAAGAGPISSGRPASPRCSRRCRRRATSGCARSMPSRSFRTRSPTSSARSERRCHEDPYGIADAGCSHWRCHARTRRAAHAAVRRRKKSRAKRSSR